MPKCRICNIDSDKQKLRADYVFGGKEEHNFWECDNCGVIYLYPYLSDEEEKYFYKKEFENWLTDKEPNTKDYKYTNQLCHILFLIEEIIGFPDYVDSVSEEQAILLWKIIETLKYKEVQQRILWC